jgi:hypothetical protein
METCILNGTVAWLNVHPGTTVPWVVPEEAPPPVIEIGKKAPGERSPPLAAAELPVGQAPATPIPRADDTLNNPVFDLRPQAQNAMMRQLEARADECVDAEVLSSLMQGVRDVRALAVRAELTCVRPFAQMIIARGASTAQESHDIVTNMIDRAIRRRTTPDELLRVCPETNQAMVTRCR